MNSVGARLKELLSAHPGWLALAPALGLASMGIAAIGTAESLSDTHTHFASHQVVWLMIALAAAALCTVPHPRTVSMAAFPLLIIALLLEIVVILPVMPRWIVEPHNGARSWIHFGSITFEPSELTKIAFVLALARYMRYRENYRTLLGLLVPFGIMFIPVGLIAKQPDLGTSLLFPPTLFAVLVAAGAKLRHLAALLALGLIAIALNVAIIYALPPTMQLLKPYQVARIKAIISRATGDTSHDKTDNYQQNKAIILAGSGGLTGLGADRAATVVHFNRLPEDHNDMIFAVIACRWGLLGGVAIMGLYLLLILSFLLVATRSKDPFTRLASIGFAGMIFSQAAINIGMNVGLMPITGINLPFVSSGGSSLVMSFAVVGLVLNFSSRRPTIVARPSFEFDQANAIYQ